MKLVRTNGSKESTRICTTEYTEIYREQHEKSLKIFSRW